MTSQNLDAIDSSRARSLGRVAREQLTNAQRNYRSALLCQKLQQCRWYQEATCVAAYVATHDEANINALIRHALSVGKTVVVPYIETHTLMRFVRVDDNTKWQIDRHGISQPIMTSRFGSHDIAATRIDVVYAPLTAFDAQFNRVGMGGGYYDRYFGMHRTRRASKRIGIGFNVQHTTCIATHEWDVGMNAIATERGIIRIKQR
ncbi:MAG: 5-formyltetrahydrofolate cyclo-ligase [Pseudomonadota bacterium]